MKIIQLIQKPQLRGAEIFACQISDQLNKLGHEAVIITLFKGDAKLPVAARQIHLERNSGKRLFDVGGLRKLANVIRSERPDIIQANAGDTLKFAVLSRFLFGWKTPIVFRNASKISDYINSTPKRIYNKLLFAAVKRVISVSHHSEKDFIETFSYPENRVTTIPIGVNPQVLPKEAPTDLKHLFSDGPVLVHVGGMSFEKNHKGLFRIFKSVVSNHPSAKLLLVGNGKLRAELEEYAKEIGLLDKIRFLGYRSDVLSIVSKADLFLLPSIIEGLPGVILESFYVGTPVIANNVGGISEIVQPGKTGWLIEKGDETAFARAIEEALNNKELVATYVNNARVLVNQEYLNPTIAERFVQQYKKILAPETAGHRQLDPLKPGLKS